MKRLLLLLIVFQTCFTANSQSDIYLKINHLLGTNSFSTSTMGTNDIGDNFTISRMQYYISSIVLVYDGGQEINVSDTWILVDATTSTNEFIGKYWITNLEGVKFSIGVESPTNHEDLTLYPVTHPLGPKSPSMHWGWASGYRFLALEGSSSNQIYEIHSLGDANYFQQVVNTEGTVNGTDLTIEIDADYEQALKSINVSSGIISHGETGVSATALTNFRDQVFTPVAAAPTGINKDLSLVNFNIYPNPSSGNELIHMNGVNLNDIIIITDLTGQKVSEFVIEKNASFSTNNLNSGMYIVSVSNADGEIRYKRLTVNK